MDQVVVTAFDYAASQAQIEVTQALLNEFQAQFDLTQKLEAAGKTIGGNDMLIAAHAVSLGHTIVTDNEREFSRVDGLPVENWLRL